MKKVTVKTWEVDFDFLPDGRCMSIKMGFKSEEEAKAWAEENTTDGEIIELVNTRW